MLYVEPATDLGDDPKLLCCLLLASSAVCYTPKEAGPAAVEPWAALGAAMPLAEFGAEGASAAEAREGVLEAMPSLVGRRVGTRRR